MLSTGFKIGRAMFFQYKKLRFFPPYGKFFTSAGISLSDLSRRIRFVPVKIFKLLIWNFGEWKKGEGFLRFRSYCLC